MRLLHTSDWHLGQTLHNYERHYEHQQFLDWLLDTLEQQQADALLIAGDIFDNANPSAASQRQFYQFLRAARERVPHLNLIVIAGNHDSPGRLEAPAPLLETHGTRVIGHVPRMANGSIDIGAMVLPLTGRSGAIEAWCLAVPFLRPADVPRLPQSEGQNSGADPYLAGIALLYRQALEHALACRSATQPIFAMGHCHMVDGQMSEDSERRIVIGGTEMLPAGMFGSDISYAALGHLHLAQSVGKQRHIRYCGSPLPLSFAEISYPHQVLQIDIEGTELGEITPLPVPRAVELLRIPARPAPLEQVLLQLAELEPQAVPAERQPLLEVRVLLDAPEPGLRARIEAALDGKAVRLAKIETTSAARNAQTDAATLTLDQLERMQPDEIFRQLYRQRFDQDAPPDQLSAFAELLLP